MGICGLLTGPMDTMLSGTKWLLLNSEALSCKVFSTDLYHHMVEWIYRRTAVGFSCSADILNHDESPAHT